jgi:hypothetical protein
MHHPESICLRSNRSSTAAKAHLSLESLETRIALYATTGNAWPHPELITISFVPDGTNLGGVKSNLFATFNAKWSTSYWENQILRAAQVWAQRANINFTVVSDNGAATGSGNYEQGDPAMGDIRIGGYNFGSSTLATAFLPPSANNYSIAGDIDINTGQVWAIGGTYDLFTVAAHEFGHALGMGHSTTASAIMYGTYNSRKSDLTTDDIAGIQAVYGSRQPDRYDAGNGNGSFATASDITSQINASTLTASISSLDILTTSSSDYFTFTAPAQTSNNLTVNVQSSGLSLLAPSMTVYAADQCTVLGAVSGTNRMGNTLSLNIHGVTAGQRFYVKVGAADSTAFGTGDYALTLNFGEGPSPTVGSPNTQTSDGSTTSTGGGQPNDTMLPNNVVTQTVLDTTNLLGGVLGNLVPGPGTMPHGPGCTCPFCRNGGYAPAAPAPASQIATVDSPADSLSPAQMLHPTGTAITLDARSVLNAEMSSRSIPNGPTAGQVASIAPFSILAPTSSLTNVGPSVTAISPSSSGDVVPSFDGSPPGDSTPWAAPDAEAYSIQAPESGSPTALDSAIGIPGETQLGEDVIRALTTPSSSTGSLSFDPWSAPLFRSWGLDDEKQLFAEQPPFDMPAETGSGSIMFPMMGVASFLGLSGGLRCFEARRSRTRSARPNGAERRGKLRYPCWLHTHCWPVGKPLIERCRSMAQDVSAAGVNLVLHYPYEEGTLLVIDLQGSGNRARKCVIARVVHVFEFAPGVWTHGCVFSQHVEDDCVSKLLLGGLRE